MWSKSSIGHCSLQRWWLMIAQPNGQSWEKLSGILKKTSQLICSIPAGQEKDKITAVYRLSSHIKYNYFKHSSMFSMRCAGAGSCTLHHLWLCLGRSAQWHAKALHQRHVGIKHLALLWVSYYWILHVHQFPSCSFSYWYFSQYLAAYLLAVLCATG